MHGANANERLLDQLVEDYVQYYRPVVHLGKGETVVDFARLRSDTAGVFTSALPPACRDRLTAPSDDHALAQYKARVREHQKNVVLGAASLPDARSADERAALSERILTRPRHASSTERSCPRSPSRRTARRRDGR